MADPYPKSYEEMVADNARLRAEVQRLQSSLGSSQAAVVARDAEIFRLKKPRVPTRTLSTDAVDVFERPAFTGRKT